MSNYIMSFEQFINESNKEQLNHLQDIQIRFTEWKEKQKARGFPIAAGDHQIPEKVVKSEIDANFQDVMKSI